MSLRIGDIVIITKGIHEGECGKIIDLKWNLVNIQFPNGQCDWVDSRHVKR